MDSDQGKLFIGGISYETDEDKLKEYFGGYGDVVQTVVMRDKMTGKPRGFGFVVFADPNILDRVLQDRHLIDGRTVEVKRALSREEQQVGKVGNPGGGRSYGGGGGGSTRTKKIFVGGLPPSLSEDGFRQYFETYGIVTDVVIMYDQQTNRPRGFGFISFDTEDAVDRVLHKTFHDISGKQVEVKRALPKDSNAGGGGGGRSMGGGAGGNSGGYQGYGSSGGHSGAYDGRTESNRYMQSQNAGGGYPSYGSSGYNPSGYGYGPASAAMGYGYGNYGGANPVGYGNPNAPGSGYGGVPPSAARGGGLSGYPSAYGYGGGPGSAGAGTGQSPSGASGYANQAYGYGGYGGNDGAYGNQAAYGAVGVRGGSGPNGSAPGDQQAGTGGYMGGAYGSGNAGWQSDPSQASGHGPQGGQGGYGGGYGGGST